MSIKSDSSLFVWPFRAPLADARGSVTTFRTATVRERRGGFFSRLLAKKLDLCLTEKDKIHRRDRDWPVDAEDCDLELVAWLDRVGEHDAIGHVEALDGGWAGVAGAARHLPIDPDFCVIVDVRSTHRRGARRVEVPDFCRYRQVRTVPEEDHFSAASPVGQPLGADRRPRCVIEAGLAGMGLDVVRRLIPGHGVRDRRAFDDLRFHALPL